MLTTAFFLCRKQSNFYIMRTEKITNPYYLAYLDHIEKSGEKETNHGFMNWIQSKHSEFRKQTGMIGREKNYGDVFTKWLNQ